MKTDYIQGIIVERSKPVGKKTPKNYMRGTWSRLASDLGIHSRPAYLAVYAKPKKLSAREQQKRYIELDKLINRLRSLN